MKGIRRYIALTLVFCMTFCSFLTFGSQRSDAASAKTVYVMTKIVINDYDPDEDEGFDTSKIVYTCAYDKKGLIKTGTVKTDNGNIKMKTSYNYRKGNKLKNSKTKTFYKGKNVNADTSKTFTVNSKGFVTKIKSYNEKKKVDGIFKYKWNKKGKVTSIQEYSSGGKLKETTKYTYSSDGKISNVKEYSPSGKVDDVLNYSYAGNQITIAELDDDGSIDTKTIVTLKNGNIMKMEEYDEDGKLDKKAVFTYKKVKTTKKNYVNAQQALITEFSL